MGTERCRSGRRARELDLVGLYTRSMRARDIEFLERWVHRHTGNLLRHVRGMPVAVRVESLAKESGMTTEELLAVVGEGLHPQLELQLMEVVLNAETLFFRDARFFRGLQEQLLPALLERRRAERRLRIWSGACSTGQEVYSLAILLREEFPELAGWHLDIIGSDLSPRRIQRATRGRYRQGEVNRGLPARYLVRHFDQDQDEWVVAPDLRAQIHFTVQNLIEPWSVTGRFDIVLLRHVLIYFDDQLRRSVLTRVHERLRGDGLLLLGSAEQPRPVGHLFDRSRPAIAGCFAPVPVIGPETRL